ncbi:MAG: ABC transporter permease, partial [Planctomycetota bacterium]|jgi:putative ABC transport system permease protein
MTKLELLSRTILGLEDGETAPRRLILFTVLAMLAFMALPAINLVNINLSRIYERSGEIGVRKAFGAASPDLVLQFVIENVVLCLIGGMIGLAGAFALLKIVTLFPQVPLLTFQLNWRIFLAALALATVFGFLSGVWPAWKMSRQHPVDALKGGAS